MLRGDASGGFFQVGVHGVGRLDRYLLSEYEVDERAKPRPPNLHADAGGVSFAKSSVGGDQARRIAPDLVGGVHSTGSSGGGGANQTSVPAVIFESGIAFNTETC